MSRNPNEPLEISDTSKRSMTIPIIVTILTGIVIAGGVGAMIVTNF